MLFFLRNSKAHLHRVEDLLQQKEKETHRLTAMFRDAESRLQMAHETIRMMREQSCVQVAVKKEVRCKDSEGVWNGQVAVKKM